ncbi:hypothetical protein SAMN05660297_02356 [Natronincola peptidivorans]|uniref:Uncharacterized protein n=1 Tax=Natronincola peptidivorans TaxID=426128 RepID=A0A1I0ECD7_9FIRM|nr:hypothetical protein [Natronincola peptidivorans]SET42130.1 hypothetical protein SAMN05660297_02356 [Natronincola peptidivorans]
MRYKLLRVLFFCFILLTFFYTYQFFQRPESIATFQSYTSPALKINKELINAYHSDDLDVKAEAEGQIIKTTLSTIYYEKWQEFIEYIELQLYEENLLPQASQQLVVALNLSKDLAVVVVFDAVADDYIYHSKIENIVPVNKIEFITNPSHSYKSMLIYQTLDEKFGSFFYEEFLQVYLYLSNGFRNIWHKTLYYEEIYKEIWVDPKADENLWNKVIEETIIDFIQDDPLTIKTFTTLEKYTTRSPQYPDKDSFTLLHTDDYKRSYYWSNQFNTFILGEVNKDVFLSDVALLEDMESSREALFGISNSNYKIITSKGEVLYLSKNKFQAMFQSFLEE